jgi:BirA family transcriptional regulator, biotin operon repressor / biotin---[acetyl-CoA-carboxylase] ligase
VSRSAYSDLERPPLQESRLNQALVVSGGLWRRVRVVPETASTNADVADAARAGVAEGSVVVAEFQTAGRGRLDRTWAAPPRSGLTFSVLLRPAGEPVPVPTARWGWLPLLTGVALAEATAGLSGLDVRLKWPNDLLIGERKLAGILVEKVQDAAVVGIGLNVSIRPQELPVPGATSLVIEGAKAYDRDPLFRATLRALATWYGRWRAVGGDPAASGLQAAYRKSCATLGTRVRVELPGGSILTGQAQDVDGDGRLVVRTDEEVDEVVAAGDVVHVR